MIADRTLLKETSALERSGLDFLARFGPFEMFDFMPIHCPLHCPIASGWPRIAKYQRLAAEQKADIH